MYKYYVPKYGKRATHIFDGTDTLCTMLSTGGLRRIDKYDLIDRAEHHSNHRRFCVMCNARRDKMKQTHNVVNEWRACINCGNTFWAKHAKNIRCKPCRESLKGFDRRRKEALERYKERKAAEALDLELLKQQRRIL